MTFDPLLLMLLAMYVVSGLLTYNLATSANPRIVLACAFIAILIGLVSFACFG